MVTQYNTEGERMSHKKTMMSFVEAGYEDICDKVEEQELQEVAKKISDSPVTWNIHWDVAIFMSLIHLGSVFAVYYMFTSAMWQTNLYTLVLCLFGGIGVTSGAHRLWSHRSYKAKLPLRIFLAICFTMAFEKDIVKWTRDHRVHHKYSETVADPHNSNRGFFFSHIGWMMMPKHAEVLEKGKKLDLSDLYADPVVRFQRKYYAPLALILAFILPAAIPMYFWGESLKHAVVISVLFRICYNYNQSWFVNSVCHMWGNRPYDASIKPTQSKFTIFLCNGEGYHNYHHTFPYDYSADELGVKHSVPTIFIDLMAYIGQAYDLKKPTEAMVSARMLRTGENAVEDKDQ